MFEFDKLPFAIQIAFLFGGAIAGALLWIAGKRSSSGERGDRVEASTIRDLQEQLLEERLARLQSDLQIVTGEIRRGIITEMHEIAGDLHSRINTLSGRIDRLAERSQRPPPSND
jgi:hypothetical protein